LRESFADPGGVGTLGKRRSIPWYRSKALADEVELRPGAWQALTDEVEEDGGGMPDPMTTSAKALDINLDPGRYGSFAEIGAGQEVGRWFFRVGGAAGTIAKTMSAYDKKVSDAIYGTAERYVSIGRLEQMLDHEYDLNIERLDRERGGETSFFAFADTVTAQNYRGDADCHGWMGIRFQMQPQAPPSQIVLHARMLDRDALMQQEALGMLGVNLVYGACRLHGDPVALLASLLDNLGRNRIEIDMVEFSGEVFEEIDHRVMSLRLVEFGLSKAAMFSTRGEVLRPTEVLYKRPVLLQRGRFRPPTGVHLDIQHRALERFCRDPRVDRERVVSLLEINLAELRSADGEGDEDFLDRIRALTAGNQSVMVSNYPRYYLVARHLARYSPSEIALPIGVGNLLEVLKEERYAELPGGLLEACALLFGARVRLYVYPSLERKTGRRLELEGLEPPAPVATLFRYLLEKRYIESIEGMPDERLRLRSDDVLAMLRRDEPGWDSFVPPEVAEAIRREVLFGYAPRP
jgi:hypothetical protein